MDEVNLNPLDYRNFLNKIEECKEQIKYYQNVIADVVLKNSNLEINNSVRLEKKDANNKIYGVIIGAKAVIKTDNEVHKLITVIPENVNTPFDFDLAEWSVSLRVHQRNSHNAYLFAIQALYWCSMINHIAAP